MNTKMSPIKRFRLDHGLSRRQLITLVDPQCSVTRRVLASHLRALEKGILSPTYRDLPKLFEGLAKMGHKELFEQQRQWSSLRYLAERGQPRKKRSLSRGRAPRVLSPGARPLPSERV